MRYPGNLDAAAADWLAARPGSRRAGVTGLSARYGVGGASAGGDLAGYVASRLPATFAASRAVMAEVAMVLAGWQPQSVLDVGAGPGAAGWAALAQWPDIGAVTQLDSHDEFLALAHALNDSSGLAALEGAVQISGALGAVVLPQADAVLCAYMLAERPESESAALALKLWAAARHVLVLLEPGTPQGFARLKAARIALLKAGAQIVGPCCHALQCPMAGDDWCHFKVRVQRSREHMHAKGAVVPYEDEPYAWLAVSRRAPETLKARVVAPVVHEKQGLKLRLCTDGQLRDVAIASRTKAIYKAYRKVAWGDAIALPDDTP